MPKKEMTHLTKDGGCIKMSLMGFESRPLLRKKRRLPLDQPGEIVINRSKYMVSFFLLEVSSLLRKWIEISSRI